MINNSFDVMCKEDGKCYRVYDIRYKSKSGYPTFLVYKKGQWCQLSAKNFIPIDLISSVSAYNRGVCE